MQADTEQRLTNILEDEVRRGFRIKELPADLQAQFTAYDLPVIERVRLTRLNPARRRKVAEVVQRRYHADLRDPELLSHEQILKLVEERGEWSKEKDERIKTLQESVNRAMGELFLDGIAQNDWDVRLLEANDTFREYIRSDEQFSEDEKAQILDQFERWVEYTPERRAVYTEHFAAEQGLESYSPDRDLNQLFDKCPHGAASDCLNTIEELRDKLQRYMTMIRERTELAQLQLTHAKIFSGSVEQRRDNTDEMARLYFCAERVDAQDTPLGPLAPTFEALYDFPEDVIQWLLIENYFFANGIPDEAREYLTTFGFLKADRDSIEETKSETGESEPSVESPAPPNSKDDSTPVAATPA